jgi:hypothetical protein
MAEIWTLTEPQVLDIGGPDQQVRGVSIMVIGGQVDVLTHDDFPGVRLEVRGLSSDVPVTVHWNGSRLKIRHQLASSMAEGDVFEALQRVFDRLGGRASHSVDLSLSVPRFWLTDRRQRWRSTRSPARSPWPTSTAPSLCAP